MQAKKEKSAYKKRTFEILNLTADNAVLPLIVKREEFIADEVQKLDILVNVIG